MQHSLVELSVVVVSCAVLSWFTLLLRQPLILAYVVSGIVAGPAVLGLVHNVQYLGDLSSIGITLLLFLAGLVTQPGKLLPVFRKTLFVNLASSGFCFFLVVLFAWWWGLPREDLLLIGMSLMFSSTLLAVKLLPTTTLHQQRMGTLLLAVLVVEDLAAVFVIMFLQGTLGDLKPLTLTLVALKGGAILAVAFGLEQYLVRRVILRFQRFEETIYLTSIAWCLGIAELSSLLGFSTEIGAFLAGLAMARSPLALYIADRLRNFRDFFLALFFFVMGARADVVGMRHMLIPALCLSSLIIAAKPLVIRQVMRWIGEPEKIAHQSGFRMGQTGEFALIISVFAAGAHLISPASYNLIQLTTLMTLLVSSVVIVKNFPTPLGVEENLKRD
ncbi:MAG TPA: cation:proton antiporter [Fibrobacteraceae bacterium]|nr:cation:proton antiporter [Fibrobacteraceae bacterium]